MCLGVPGRIIALDEEEPGLALVDSGGVRRRVDVSCVLPAEGAQALLGRWVVVHVGFALALISEEEALASLALIARMLEPPS